MRWAPGGALRVGLGGFGPVLPSLPGPVLLPGNPDDPGLCFFPAEGKYLLQK